MATSRTGTAAHKRAARWAKHQARQQGLENCPLCGARLNWKQGLTPTSPEADHIRPYSLGGDDSPENFRVICRACNQSRGNRAAPSRAHLAAARPLKVSRQH